MKQARKHAFEQLLIRMLSHERGNGACLICQGKRQHERLQWSSRTGAHAFSLQRWLCTSCEQAIPWIRRIHCTRCGRGTACPDCRRKPKRAFAWNRSAVCYDPFMRDWLAQYKFRGRERLLPLLAGMMLPVTRAIIDDLKNRQGRSVVLTYVPLSRERQAERGFNQAEQLAAYLAGALELPICSLLDRHHHTRKQSFQARRNRLHALRGAFTFTAPRGLPAVSQSRPFVLIVDDVYTTGSTLEEAAKTIRESVTCDVAGLTWARA